MSRRKKHPGGRPPKPPGERQDARYVITARDEQMAAWQAAADREETTLAGWMRRALDRAAVPSDR